MCISFFGGLKPCSFQPTLAHQVPTPPAWIFGFMFWGQRPTLLRGSFLYFLTAKGLGHLAWSQWLGFAQVVFQSDPGPMDTHAPASGKGCSEDYFLEDIPADNMPTKYQQHTNKIPTNKDSKKTMTFHPLFRKVRLGACHCGAGQAGPFTVPFELDRSHMS